MLSLDKYIINDIITSMKTKNKYHNFSLKSSESHQELLYNCHYSLLSRN
jgi:hypothetical protein